jgi:Flp pilus assembly protein TadG
MRNCPRARQRNGAAVVELAILLPLLAFLFVIGVDFARVYKHTLTLTNSARNGAHEGSRGPSASLDDARITLAALADARDMTPPPTVAIRRFAESDGSNHIEVTVSWTFETITTYPGVPSPLNLTRTVQMRVAPAVPLNNPAP